MRNVLPDMEQLVTALSALSEMLREAAPQSFHFSQLHKSDLHLRQVEQAWHVKRINSSCPAARDSSAGRPRVR
ncbi:hypothetical protein [Streptomyces bullii]